MAKLIRAEYIKVAYLHAQYMSQSKVDKSATHVHTLSMAFVLINNYWHGWIHDEQYIASLQHVCSQCCFIGSLMRLTSSTDSPIFAMYIRKKRERVWYPISCDLPMYIGTMSCKRGDRFWISSLAFIYQTQLFKAFKSLATLAWNNDVILLAHTQSSQSATPFPP